MTEEQREERARQENEVVVWLFQGVDAAGRGGRFPLLFDAIRKGEEVFVIPSGPLVRAEHICLMLHVPADIECSKTETGFVLSNSLKVV